MACFPNAPPGKAVCFLLWIMESPWKGSSPSPRDFANAMRSAVSAILIPLLCAAFLGSISSLDPTDRRPEMLGADLLDLCDAVRLVRGVTAEADDAFLDRFRSAVLALEAVAEAGPKLVSGDSKASFFSGNPVFVCSSIFPLPFDSGFSLPVPSRSVGFGFHEPELPCPPPKIHSFRPI